MLEINTNGTSPGKIIVAHKSIPLDTEPKYTDGFMIIIKNIKKDKSKNIICR
jgi:hypothetical protein